MNKPGLFVDAAGWMAMADGADPTHESCRRARDSHLADGGVLVTTDYVVAETLTLIRARLGPAAAERWWAQVEASSRVRWERIGAARGRKAREWFFERPDDDASVTDCASFVVMRGLGLTRALTTGRHFSGAGFETVPAGSTGSRRRRFDKDAQ